MLDTLILDRIEAAENNIAERLEHISDFIYRNPELGLEEQIACEFLCGVMEEYGFRVTKGCCGADTAFLAELDNGPGPIIAFLAEYDALPRFGPGGGPGHACGHNWIAATTVGAAIVLSRLKDAFKGRLLLIGTPGMENYGFKVDLVKRNVFDDIDLVIQSHLEKYTSVNCVTNAMDAIQFSFTGRATHAAQHPEEGVNALDAVQFTFAGINALKNYLRQDVNIHGIITQGGDNPTVIPEYAECKFYLRARDRAYLDKIRPRVIRCAEGAALMTGTKMQHCNFSNPLDNLINNEVLSSLAGEYLEHEGIPVSDDYEKTHFFGSTDIGSVSHVCPTMYIEVAMELPEGQFTIHSDIAMKYVNSSYAYKRLHQMVRIMSGVALEIFNDSRRLDEIKICHRKTVNQHWYG